MVAFLCRSIHTNPNRSDLGVRPNSVPFTADSDSYPRVRVISALVHEANRVVHGKEHVREKDHYSSLRTEPRWNPPPGFLLKLCITSSSTDVSRITIHLMKNLRLLAAESLSPLVVGLFSFPPGRVWATLQKGPTGVLYLLV